MLPGLYVVRAYVLEEQSHVDEWEMEKFAV